MPVKTTKYTCKHKCGHKAISSAKLMHDHEDKHCFKNPEMRTCETCIHRIYEKDTTDYEEGNYTYHMRGCKVEEMNEFLYDVHEMLVIKGSVKQHVKPLFKCPCHNLKEGQVPFMLAAYKTEVKRLLNIHFRPSEAEQYPF